MSGVPEVRFPYEALRDYNSIKLEPFIFLQRHSSEKLFDFSISHKYSVRSYCIEIITAEKTLTLSASDRSEWDIWASVLRSVTSESAGGARKITTLGGVQVDSLDCDPVKDLPSRIMAAPASGAGSVVSLMKTARNGEVESAQAGCRRILELACTTEGREALCMEGAVHTILVAMRGNSEHCSVAEWGCAALAHLASGDDSKVTQRRIHIAESAASAIIAVMRVHSRHARVQVPFVRTLSFQKF